MFTKSIIDSDLFLEMPLSTQALYFHLCMRADDEGFLSSPKRILKAIGCNEDDLKLLISKGFVICFDSGIVVITHWNMHNHIQKDRFRPTIYEAEKALLTSKGNKEYALKEPYKLILDTNCTQNVSNADTQNRLDKNRLDKVSIDTLSTSVDGRTAFDYQSVVKLIYNLSTYVDGV